MKPFWIRSLFAFAALFATVVVTNLHAADLGTVKQRMAQRLSAVDALRDRGAAGENNRGFLEARGAVSGAESQTISDENSDRSAVYAALAQQTGTSADQVGRARAKQIAQGSKGGVWLQRESGEWYKK